jgi:uncharacterized protein YraI
VDVNPADAAIPAVGAVDTTATSTPAAGGLVVTATPFNVNIRSEPNVDSERLDLLPAGQSAEVIGRVADNSWWQINFNGITGWVSAEFAIIAEGADINSIPVTG